MKPKNIENKENKLYFLCLADIEHSEKMCGKYNLQKSLLFLLIFSCQLFFTQMIFDYLFAKSTCKICPIFNFFLFSPLNYIALAFLIKSQNNKKSVNCIKISNSCIVAAFYYHFLLLIFNSLFGFYFSSVDLFFLYKNREKCCGRLPTEKMITFIIPNFIYLFYECFMAWISYSYTKLSSISVSSYEIVSSDNLGNSRINFV